MVVGVTELILDCHNRVLAECLLGTWLVEWAIPLCMHAAIISFPVKTSSFDPPDHFKSH